MTDVVGTEIQNIFCRYKENQEHILIDAFNNIQTCDGCHLARTKNVQRKKFWIRQVKKLYLIISIILFVLASFGMLLLKSFNHAKILGGCYIYYLWPFDECPVAY